MSRRVTPSVVLLLAAVACAPAGSKTSSANTGDGLPPELLFCRTQRDKTSTSAIELRTAQNLGTRHLFDRAGRELHVRVHPSGTLVVFARERALDNRASRELIVSSIDGSTADRQLTTNNVQDDMPCWSPTGDRIVFASDRDGESRLYATNATGTPQQPFLSAAAGTDDRDPDWSRSTDRIVFSRREAATGLRRLMLVNGDGTGLVPLTTGSPSTVGDTDTGDREPTFSPDGARVVFVRLAGSGSGQLVAVDIATGITAPVLDPQGTVRLPRFSPSGDRLFFGLDQSGAGRPGIRLAQLRIGSVEPSLIEPGVQWTCDGVDVLPAMPAAPVPAAPEVLDVTGATIELASGILTSGGKPQLAAADGSELGVATATFNGREIAAINCQFTLPSVDLANVVALRARITARLLRGDGDSALRTSVFTPVGSRFDTVGELRQVGTTPHTFGFTLQSLAHVSLEKVIRFTVIGDATAGARTELRIDQVQLELIRRLP